MLTPPDQRSQLLLLHYPPEQSRHERIDVSSLDGRQRNDVLHFDRSCLLDHRKGRPKILDAVWSRTAGFCVHHGGHRRRFVGYRSAAGELSILSTVPGAGLTPLQWGAVAITFLFFYYAAFGCTWGMVPWIYQAEINSLAMRVRGAAAATSMNWLFGFVCTQFTSVGIRNLGYRFYISESSSTVPH